MKVEGNNYTDSIIVFEGPSIYGVKVPLLWEKFHPYRSEIFIHMLTPKLKIQGVMTPPPVTPCHPVVTH